MNIGIDIDGVLTDIRKFQIEKGEKFFNRKCNNKNGFTINEMFNCNEEESKKFWTKYLLEYSIFFKARLNASQVINNIRNKDNKVFIITSREFTDKDNFLGKLMRYIVSEWLKTNKIYYDKIIYCGKSKVNEIKNNNINVMIEDNKDNINELSKYCKIIAMNEPYNIDSVKENVFRANNWIEVDNYLKTLEKMYNAKENNNKLTGFASIDKPWEKYYTHSQLISKVPNYTAYECLKNGILENRNNEIINYLGKTITGREMLDNISNAKKSLENIFNMIGIKENEISKEIITICSNNIPEALYTFYGANRLGVVVNFIHPFSSIDNIIDNINKTKSKILFCIDFNYEKIKNIINETSIEKVVILSPKDSMPLLIKIAYCSKTKTNIKEDNNFINYNNFIKLSASKLDYLKDFPYKKDYPAVILNTGGTTGKPKGAVLSNDNFNSMPHQYGVKANFTNEDKMVAIMPIFHGFGLCNCIHMPLCLGAKVILMPKYDAKQLANIFKKYKPCDLMGVPTLIKDIMNNKIYENIDFSFINYIVSGGGSLGADEVDFNKFLSEHNSNKLVTKGYGLTEATSSLTFTFEDSNDINSVGIPLVNTKIKIVEPGTTKELKYNELGEICATGPSIMLGFYKDDKSTKNDLKMHNDNKVWLHTGDMGYINEDGKLFVTDRIKRLIIVSGVNVYPSLIENKICTHPLVKDCCVVKMPHDYKYEVPKAYIVLKEGNYFNEKLKIELNKLCDALPNKYYKPFDFEVIDSLPKTLMNKIDYKNLEEKAKVNKKVLRKEL